MDESTLCKFSIYFEDWRKSSYDTEGCCSNCEISLIAITEETDLLVEWKSEENGVDLEGYLMTWIMKIWDFHW